MKRGAKSKKSQRPKRIRAQDHLEQDGLIQWVTESAYSITDFFGSLVGQASPIESEEQIVCGSEFNPIVIEESYDSSSETIDERFEPYRPSILIQRRKQEAPVPIDVDLLPDPIYLNRKQIQQTADHLRLPEGYHTLIHDLLDKKYEYEVAKVSNLLRPWFKNNNQFTNKQFYLYESTIEDYLKRLTSQNPFVTSENIWDENGTMRKNKKIKHRDGVKLWLLPRGAADHWFLSMILQTGPTSFSIFVLDTLAWKSFHSEIMDDAKEFCSKLITTDQCEIEFDLHTIDVIKQSNGIDCGAGICYYANVAANIIAMNPEVSPEVFWGALLENQPKDPIEYTNFRLKMAEEIAGPKPSLRRRIRR